jgi:hypothetical protein
MTKIRKLVSSAAIVAVIAVGIVATFTLVRMVDGDVEAAPIVEGSQPVE